MVLPEALARTVRLTTLHVPDVQVIVDQTSERLVQRFPEILMPGSALWTELSDHGARHLEHMDVALLNDDPTVLSDYLKWVSTYLVCRGLPKRCLNDHLVLLVDSIASSQDAAIADRLRALLDQAAVDTALPRVESSRQNPGTAQLSDALLAALLDGDRDQAVSVVSDAFDRGLKTMDIYVGIIQPVMYSVGELWQNDEITYDEEHVATATLPSVLAHCQRRSHVGAVPERGTFAITGVEGELHEVGLQVVTDLLEANGWRVRNLGPNNPADVVLGTMLNDRPLALGISVSMARSLPTVQALIEALHGDPVLATCPVVVGGGAFQRSERAWERIGADAYAPDPQALLQILDNLSSSPPLRID